MNRIRVESLGVAAKAGLVVPATLPLLEVPLSSRTQDEAMCRLLCLNAVAAAAFGFDRTKALKWLGNENLTRSLTDQELTFLETGKGVRRAFQVQVEAAWALAWALELVPALDFWHDCSDDFVFQLPNLEIAQSSIELRSKTSMRSVDTIAAMCDLAYCLHWAIRQAELDGRPPPAGLEPYVVVERRRTLEWLLSQEAWDEISLDT